MKPYKLYPFYETHPYRVQLVYQFFRSHDKFYGGDHDILFPNLSSALLYISMFKYIPKVSVNLISYVY